MFHLQRAVRLETLSPKPGGDALEFAELLPKRTTVSSARATIVRFGNTRATLRFLGVGRGDLIVSVSDTVYADVVG